MRRLAAHARREQRWLTVGARPRAAASHDRCTMLPLGAGRRAAMRGGGKRVRKHTRGAVARLETRRR